MKRWSRGVYLGQFHEWDYGHGALCIGTSTDSIEGMSGGPILNGAGEAVSAVAITRALPDEHYPYRGSDDVRADLWQTLGPPCQVFRDFVRSAVAQ